MISTFLQRMQRRQLEIKYAKDIIRVVQLYDYQSFLYFSVLKLFSICVIFMSKKRKILRRKKFKTDGKKIYFLSFTWESFLGAKKKVLGLTLNRSQPLT